MAHLGVSVCAGVRNHGDVGDVEVEHSERMRELHGWVESRVLAVVVVMNNLLRIKA
jgi:hypothetical protein